MAKHLQKDQLLNCRQINRLWNSEISSWRLPTSFIIKFDGKKETGAELCEKMVTLVSSKVMWMHFEFKNMNFDEDVQRGLLKVFNVEHGDRCKSIHLNNCNMQMSDFIQLIAKAETIQELKITECPSIYNSGSHILNVSRLT